MIRYIFTLNSAALLFFAATAVQAVGIQNDFNKDGFDDLVIGVSADHELLPANVSSGLPGTVNVIKGSALGLSATGNQLWNQNSLGIVGNSNRSFGTAVASADFNGDGFADLAVGSPTNSGNLPSQAGEITIIYGTAAGLASTKSQLWHQGSPGILEDPEGGDLFGQTLAAGDFNNDHFDDLAVGVPGEHIAGIGFNVGVVNVFYGSLVGIRATNNQLWSQNSPGIVDEVKGGEFFGSALASGDFDNDGFDDLAIGVPLEHSGAEPGLGAVHVLYGSLSRLTANRSQFWDQLSPGVLGDGQGWERFGEALAAGDFNGDGRDDLAVGAPMHVVNSINACGAVNVLYGAAGGLSATGNQLWNEETPGIAEVCDVQARFGLALVAADFNGDKKADLAIAAPRENFLPGSTHPSKGAVHVLKGSANRLTATGSQFWTQDSPGIPDTAEQGDYFGTSLGAGDYNNDGRYELVIGVPREKVGTLVTAGVVHVLKGSGTGPTATGNQLLSQDSPGIPGTTQTGDLFGASLGH